MKKTRFSVAAAATLVLSSPLLLAQAKPSPYEGVSAPPADDAITTSQQAPATPSPASDPAATPASRAAAAPAPVTKPNPDAGIVETPLSAQDSKAPDTPLHGRRFDASTAHLDEGIVTEVPAPANALPEGTVFKVRMLQDIDAGSTSP